VFHSKPEEAAELIDKLRAAGYAVSVHPRTQAPSLREIQESAPEAVVIDLSRMPSQGRAIGAWLRGSKSTRHIPLVFVDGDAAKVAALRNEIPDAVYTSLAGIGGAVKKAIAHPPAEPVVPRQMMQSAQPRTNAQKLGIREGSMVGLIDPPPDYIRVLGELPSGVVIEEDTSRVCAVTLWFVRDAGEYAAHLPRRKALASRSRLWIVWQKGRRDGLNGNRVRAAALQLGLVDYKICSLDAVWSGLAFAIARPT
jgi:CheY-like chemotaxis protein